MHIYIKLCNQNSVGFSLHIFEFDETEAYFEIPIHYPSNFGSKPKKMVPFRSDGHPTCIEYVILHISENHFPPPDYLKKH